MDRVHVGVKFTGEWWDEYWELRDGVPVKVHTSEVLRNTQMDAFAEQLVPGLCSNEVGLVGFQYMAQGIGDPGWGPTPPAVTTSDPTLFNEIYRQVPDSIVYLDGSDVPTLSRT